MDGGIIILVTVVSLLILFVCICILCDIKNNANENERPDRQHRSTSIRALLDEKSISLQPYVNAEDTDHVKKTEKSDLSIAEVTEICRYCIGKGYKLCRECKGDGLIPELIDDEKGRETYEKEICVNCDGNGRYLCKYCNGMPKKIFKRHNDRYVKSKESNKSDFERAMSVAKNANTAYNVVSNGIKIVKALS